VEATVQASPVAQPIEAQRVAQLVEMKPLKFSFRTTDIETGKEVPDPKDPTKTVKEVKKFKRPTFESNLPLLTYAGLVAAISAEGKVRELVLDAVNEIVVDRYRGLINDALEADFGVELKPDLFNIDKLSITEIANLPKSERGAGIPKEVWGKFVADYKETMQKPEAIALFDDKKARAPETLDKHGIILGGKFNPVRSRKDVIGQMLGFLDIWVQVSTNAEEFQACYDHLLTKGKALMQGEEFTDL
jgi:hypothetical protein